MLLLHARKFYLCTVIIITWDVNSAAKNRLPNYACTLGLSASQVSKSSIVLKRSINTMKSKSKKMKCDIDKNIDALNHRHHVDLTGKNEVLEW